MSKGEKLYWAVTVSIDYAAKEYRGANVVRVPDGVGPLGPYVQVQADDEIGAFNEAQKVLQRLGFRIGA